PEISASQIVSETERAIALLEGTGEEHGLAEGLRLLGEARMYEGQAEEGQRALERALGHVEPATAPRSWNAISFAMGMCLLDGPATLEPPAEVAGARLAGAALAGGRVPRRAPRPGARPQHARDGGRHAARAGSGRGATRAFRRGPRD